MNYEYIQNEILKNNSKFELIKKIEFLLKIHNAKFDEIYFLKLNFDELKIIYIEYLKDFNQYPVQMLKFEHNEKLLNLEIYLN